MSDGGISFEKRPEQPDGPAPASPAPGFSQPVAPGLAPGPFPLPYAPPQFGYPGPPGYGPYGFGGPPGPPPGPRPSNNIGWAIGAIFTFWPLAIPAFINSSRVDTAWYAGDWYGAQRASESAKKFGMIGVIVGASLLALYLLFFVLVFGLIASSG